MDSDRWHLWRTADGVYWAIRMNTGGKVRLTAASAQERADMITAWEREHPDAT